MNKDKAIYEALNSQNNVMAQFHQGKLSPQETAIKIEDIWKHTIAKIQLGSIEA